MQAITFSELLRYTDGETRRWHSWMAEQPAAILDESLGEGRIGTIRELLVHVFAVELRYAQRLLDEPVTSFESLPRDSLDAIFAIGAEGRRKLAGYLSTDPAPDLDRLLTFQTLTAGTQSGSARKIVAHSILHGIRHWAQIAMVLRQRGYPPQWFHDVLMSDALV
jgi:uncharacterized damage-inducible protein DinB